MKTSLTLSFVSHLLEWEAVYLLIKTDRSNGNHIRGLPEGHGGTVLHIPTKQNSILTLLLLEMLLAGSRRWAGADWGTARCCPGWLCWASVVGLQPLRGTRPSQPASSLDSGSAHPAASTRGHCYTKEEEEEEERDKFRKHCSLEVLFPGLANVHEALLFLLRCTREKGWPLGASGTGLFPPQILLTGTTKSPLYPNPPPCTM